MSKCVSDRAKPALLRRRKQPSPRGDVLGTPADGRGIFFFCGAVVLRGGRMTSTVLIGTCGGELPYSGAAKH
jgi:hypothetical protein